MPQYPSRQHLTALATPGNARDAHQERRQDREPAEQFEEDDATAPIADDVRVRQVPGEPLRPEGVHGE